MKNRGIPLLPGTERPVRTDVAEMSREIQQTAWIAGLFRVFICPAACDNRVGNRKRCRQSAFSHAGRFGIKNDCKGGGPK